MLWAVLALDIANSAADRHQRVCSIILDKECDKIALVKSLSATTTSCQTMAKISST